ncbi:no significant blast hit [Histoplasma capsulatum G186AR]|uniref:Uncharacterized protein n=1 Tax=Ajellomyces capsulatus TaxID=5037 RepID=A0A8H7Z4S8_AJECA|nr:hypothetical protein I7I52_02391 [Histoplasma capsulatum]QSS69748.1 no significant blast hit [Histoplasma capsulatum G186AR]
MLRRLSANITLSLPLSTAFNIRCPELTGLGCQKRKRKRKMLEAVLSTVGDYHNCSVEYPHQN